MPRFRKKPIIVEAMQFDGSLECAKKIYKVFPYTNPEIGVDNKFHKRLWVKTPVGIVYAYQNDWVVQGVKKDLCVYKDEIFKMSYDEVKSLEQDTKDYPTIKRYDCGKCGNPWWFDKPHIWVCTMCGNEKEKTFKTEDQCLEQ